MKKNITDQFIVPPAKAGGNSKSWRQFKGFWQFKNMFN